MKGITYQFAEYLEVVYMKDFSHVLWSGDSIAQTNTL